MVPRDPDIAYHLVMTCLTLLKKQDIETINVCKREAKPFPIHPNQTRVAIVCCHDQDKVSQRLISSIKEKSIYMNKRGPETKFYAHIVEYGHNETQLAKV